MRPVHMTFKSWNGIAASKLEQETDVKKKCRKLVCLFWHMQYVYAGNDDSKYGKLVVYR